MDRIEQLAERLKAKVVEVRAIADAADAASRDFTDAERSDIVAKTHEAQEIKAELSRLKADDEARKALNALGADVPGRFDGGNVKRAPNGHIARAGVGSLGESFTASKEYADLLASAPGGHFSKDHRIATRPVTYDRLLTARGQKALVTGASPTSGGSLVWPEFLGLQMGMDAFQRPLVLRNLVTQGQTGSDTVEFVRITGVTNSAAPVAEATTTANGTKPESGFTTARVTETVKTIAHWIPATKRALSDAAQVRTLIDSYLEYGLEESLENQMVSGDGTGENLTGLAATSGVQAQPWDTDLLTTLRKSKTLVRTVGRSIPTGWVMNPDDVEALDLLKDATGRYYFGGPSGGAATNGGLTTPLWNLPVIETQAVPAGTAYIGDWRKAVLWNREQASIVMSDSHANFFIQNLVAILAEERVAFGIIQPNAFVSVDLTP